jgi:DNA/RNA-binding domain of Phe-tRNA-synthetase-like protein
VARRWLRSAASTSAANETTTHAIITVEAHHRTAQQEVQRALADLNGLLETYAGGTRTTALLTADQPAV